MKLKLLFIFLFLVNFSFAHEVLTLTEPLLDYILFVDDDFLSKIPGEKGGRELVDSDLLSKLVDLSEYAPKRIPGGSSTNVIKCLAHLGHSCAVIGKIGQDEPGHFYKEELERQGITPRMLYSSLPTGKCAVFVTPDGERTMRTSLGAAADSENFIMEGADFQGITLLHLEGYILFDPLRVMRSIALAKEQNALISFTLSSFEVVRAHKEMLPSFLKDNVDILFCNEDEAFALTELSPQEACASLAKLCSVVAVTMGKKGSWVQHEASQYYIPACVANTLDSTGAGDCFSGGFLHGFLSGLSIDKCGHLGAFIAKEVVEVIGAQVPEERWSKIREATQNLATSCLELPVNQDVL